MKVTNVMTTHPVTVEPSDTIRQADEIMGLEDVRQLPVVKGKQIVGIITDRDIRFFLGGRRLETLEEKEKAMKTKVAVGFAWIGYRWIIPSLSRWLPRRPQHSCCWPFLCFLALVVWRHTPTWAWWWVPSPRA